MPAPDDRPGPIGDPMFTWEELDAAPGQYIVGFIVEDLDGNAYESLATVGVE